MRRSHSLHTCLADPAHGDTSNSRWPRTRPWQTPPRRPAPRTRLAGDAACLLLPMTYLPTAVNLAYATPAGLPLDESTTCSPRCRPAVEHLARTRTPRLLVSPSTGELCVHTSRCILLLPFTMPTSSSHLPPGSRPGSAPSCRT